MRELPIVMRDDEVRAILAGTKTQARRIVTPMPGRQSQWLSIEHIGQSPRLTIARLSDAVPDRRWRGRLGASMEHPKGGPGGWVAAPGDVGDRLWVRECWGIFDRGPFGTPYAIARRATQPNTEDGVTWVDGPEEWHGEKWLASERWRSAASMPRWASRITLAVTSVRVERVRSMSQADARAEGVEATEMGGVFGTPDYVGAFARLWDAINGKRAGCSWADDPWVWAVGFEVVR